MDYYAGIDVSLEASSVCVVDANGKILREAKVLSEPEALIGWFCGLEHGLARIGLEAGPLSQWLYAAMKQAGLAVELLETRHVGARSILGDPRSATMQRNLNLKVKYRESFRPFAPSVLREDAADWFELETDSPYMLIVADVREKRRRAMTLDEQTLFGIDKLNVARSEISAVTHVDYSARIQTVHANTNPLFHRLLKRFKTLTGCPVLVNTSFNVRGEPIVCTREDAFRCFMGNDLDLLVVGNCILHKTEQDPNLKRDYSTAFDAD